MDMRELELLVPTLFGLEGLCADNFEGLTGDIAFRPSSQRAACVDIRYTLFIIDKYAGASHIIDELTIEE